MSLYPSYGERVHESGGEDMPSVVLATKFPLPISPTNNSMGLVAYIDQCLNIQAQGKNDCNNHVTLRCNVEVNMGVPTFINIHRQKNYQLAKIGGAQDCSTISNEEGKATPSPTILGRRGENRMIDFQCENESDQVIVWTCRAFSNVYQICFR